MTPFRSRQHRQKLQAQRRKRLDALMELVADGSPVKEAGRQIGISEATATSLMAQARRELGVQAI